MQNRKVKIKALIGLSLLTVGLAGCGVITGAAMNDAIEACERHDGVKSLHPLYLNTSNAYEVECVNGNKFTGRAREDAR